MWDNCPKNQADKCVFWTIQLACEIGKPVIFGCFKDAMCYTKSQAPTKNAMKSINGIVESHFAAENSKYNISLNSLYKHKSAFC